MKWKWKESAFDLLHLDCLWLRWFNIVMHLGHKPQTQYLISKKIWNIIYDVWWYDYPKRGKPVESGLFLVRTLDWQSLFINSDSRKCSTHMDSRIHRAFPRKRYKDNKLYWQTCTAKPHKRRAGELLCLPALIIFFPFCSYRWSPAASSIIVCLCPPSLL